MTTCRFDRKVENIKYSACQYVQSDIRYVAIELGIGGWQPHPAKDIYSNHYGDCKDKATLLSTMLKEIGVDSDYIVVNTRRGAVNAETPPAALFQSHYSWHSPAGRRKETRFAGGGIQRADARPYPDIRSHR